MKKIVRSKVGISIVALMLMIGVGSSCTTSKKYGCPGAIAVQLVSSLLK